VEYAADSFGVSVKSVAKPARLVETDQALTASSSSWAAQALRISDRSRARVGGASLEESAKETSVTLEGASSCSAETERDADVDGVMALANA